MKIVALSIISKEADRYLVEVLDKLKTLVDDAVICFNNSDDKTKNIVKSYGFKTIEDNREWGKFQPFIKTDTLREVGKLNPDIVLPVDADEVYCQALTRKEVEYYGMMYPACYFYIINMWNDKQHYKKSMSFWNIRMFRYDKNLPMHFQNTPVHCGLAPVWAYKFGSYVPFFIKHYGLMKPEDRQRKIERYEKYDPKAIYKDRSYYEALAQIGSGVEYNEQEIQRRIEEEVSKYGNQNKNITQNTMVEKFVYLKRLKDGAIIDVPERHKDQLVKSGKFEFVSEVGITNGATEAPVVEKPVETPLPTLSTLDKNPIDNVPPKNPLECNICGKVCGSLAGLSSHARKHK
jgi:hypothetical protein